MNGTWHNGRVVTDDEAAAVRHGYQCAHERDLRLLAGLLAEEPRQADTLAGRTVADIWPKFS